MADSFVSKLISELTEKTTAADTDLIPVSDKSGNFFKMTWKKLKELMLGTKDISGVGDGTVTGAISELNTKLPYKIIIKNFANVSTESSKGYIIMNPSDFGLNKLHLVIVEDITVPNGKKFNGFYTDSKGISYIEVRNADNSIFSGNINFTAIAIGN